MSQPPDGFSPPLFAEVSRECPDPPIIIEYLGGIGCDEAPPYTAFRRILTLAQHPDACIKVHGLGDVCHRPVPMRFTGVPPFMEVAYDAFGASRLKRGSDFPPVAGREGYRNAPRWTLEHMPFRTDAGREWVFGRTVLSLHKFAH